MAQSRDLVLLEWEVDKDGYEIESEPARSGSTLLTSFGPSQWIRPCGGALANYEPLKVPGLFREFAKLRKTEAAVLKFANTYGLLGYGFGDGRRGKGPEPLESWYQSIDAMRYMVRLATDRQWPVLSKCFDDARLGRMFVKLDWDERARLAPVIVPDTLRHALYLQLVQAAAGRQQFRQCLWCGTWFAYGPGTGRRSTSKYCSGTCRTKAFLERNA